MTELQFGQKSLIIYKRLNFNQSIDSVDHTIAVVVEEYCLRDIKIQVRPIVLSIGSLLFYIQDGLYI